MKRTTTAPPNPPIIGNWLPMVEVVEVVVKEVVVMWGVVSSMLLVGVGDTVG